MPRLLFAGLVFALTGASPYFGQFMNANERPRLLQGIAWVEDGTSAIDGPSTRHIPPGIDVSRTPAGKLVPNKPPGTTLPAALAYGIVGTTDSPTLMGYTQLARGIGGWLPMIMLLAFAWRQRRDRAGAFGLAALSLATPCLAYSRLLYGHVLAAALLWGGVMLLDRARVDRRIRWAFMGGLVAGAAVTVEYLAAFAGVPIGVWLVLDARKHRAWSVVATALAGACVPIAGLMLYHQALFGSPWLTPYHFVEREGFAEIHGQGLLGLTWPTTDSVFEHLLSPWGGLLYWAPLSVLAIAASVGAIRKGDDEPTERVGLAIVVLLLLLNLCLAQTGGWRVGPRYLVVALPFLLPGLRRLHAWLGRPGWGALVVALLGWSLFANFFAAGLFPHLVPEGNPLRDLLLPLWAEGLRPHSLWGSWGMGLAGVATLAVFVVVTRPETSRGRVWWLTGLVGAIGLVFAALVVPQAPAAEDTFAAVRRIWQPYGGQQPAPRLLRP